MSELALRTVTLGKSYRLQHSPARPYRTLREDLSVLASRPLSWLRHHSRPQSEVFWALRDVSIEVRRGEVVGLIGRNGAGKTTLLKILARVTTPTMGHAELYGRTGSLLEVGTGFHPELTGRENIFLNGTLLGMRVSEVRRKFDEIVAFAEIERFLDTPVKRLSSGMYVRLAFAVAAHLEPEVLLIDEVLAVGDTRFQRKCLDKMEDVAQGGRTILFVSHNLGAVRRLCARSVLLAEGTVAAIGPTDQVIDLYTSDALSGRAAEYTQPKDETRAICLRRVALLVGGTPATEVDFGRGFTLEIDYDVNSSISDCIVWASIRTVEETIVFDTADYDVNPSLLRQRTPGTWRARVDIPARWLNAGAYYVVVGIAGQFPVVSFDRVRAVYFTVVDTTPYTLPEAADRPGVLKPQLFWNVERRDAH